MLKLARAHLGALPATTIPRDPRAAAVWYRRGVDLWDDPDCHFGLAQLLLSNSTDAESADVAAAVDSFEAAARHGHAFAAYNLGTAALFGLGGRGPFGKSTTELIP